MRQIFVRMGTSIFLLALPMAHAQQRVQDFLQPHTYTHPAIDNRVEDNPPVTYRAVCGPTNESKIFCRTFAPKLPSGGGKNFGPWYWIAPEVAPIGYKFSWASFSLPLKDSSGYPVAAPDHCYGDGNSPMQPPDFEALKQGKTYRDGNPDTQWMGHKNGTDHAFAVCFIQREDANGPKWLYNLQGQEGHFDISVFPLAGTDPFTGDPNWFKIEPGRNGAVSEPAELDVFYEKAN